MPRFNMDYGYVSVSSKFIEDYMPEANAEFVKVYLWTLNLARREESVELSEIAASLGLIESDVLHAISYWESKGILKSEDGRVTFYSPESFPKGGNVHAAGVADGPGYAPGEAASAIYNDSDLSEMVTLAQEILGKPLNTSDTETLYWFYDGLKFSPEVILMLLEYCVSKGKRRMSYIEKVAISWHERRITSMEAVNEYIQKENEKSGKIYSVRKILGINNRALSTSEEQYINRWLDMYHMDETMIERAYDQCIMQTAKLSFQYMEKILERWHTQGIHTVAEAEADELKFKNTRSAKTNGSQTGNLDRGYEVFSDDYDHDELEKLTRKKR